MLSASKTQGAGWRNGVHRTSERRRVGLRRFSYVESENVRKRGCHCLKNSPSVHPKIPVLILACISTCPMPTSIFGVDGKI